MTYDWRFYLTTLGEVSIVAEFTPQCGDDLLFARAVSLPVRLYVRE
ncbi:MAG: hypothetical protein OXU20_14735 [Myxococcales bacterium]|nr:hypothetical protein [Myxococcales bacterium]